MFEIGDLGDALFDLQAELLGFDLLVHSGLAQRRFQALDLNGGLFAQAHELEDSALRHDSLFGQLGIDLHLAVHQLQTAAGAGNLEAETTHLLVQLLEGGVMDQLAPIVGLLFHGDLVLQGGDLARQGDLEMPLGQSSSAWAAFSSASRSLTAADS